MKILQCLSGNFRGLPASGGDGTAVQRLSTPKGAVARPHMARCTPINPTTERVAAADTKPVLGLLGLRGTAAATLAFPAPSLQRAQRRGGGEKATSVGLVSRRAEIGAHFTRPPSLWPQNGAEYEPPAAPVAARVGWWLRNEPCSVASWNSPSPKLTG
jgi:hypothetical protein